MHSNQYRILLLYIVIGVRKGIMAGKALGGIGYVNGGDIRDGISERRSSVQGSYCPESANSVPCIINHGIPSEMFFELLKPSSEHLKEGQIDI